MKSRSDVDAGRTALAKPCVTASANQQRNTPPRLPEDQLAYLLEDLIYFTAAADVLVTVDFIHRELENLCTHAETTSPNG